MSLAPAAPRKEEKVPVKKDGYVAAAAKRALEDSDEVVELTAVKREKKSK